MKVLYDEGTPEEKRRIRVAVEKLSEESHCKSVSTFLNSLTVYSPFIEFTKYVHICFLK